MAEFKNETEGVVTIRKSTPANKAGYEWVRLQPGETIDLSVEQGRRYGLELLNKDVEVQERVSKSDDEFVDELLAIKGVGKATAAEIIGEYESRDRLVVAIEGGEELPFPDNVQSALKEHFEE